MKKSPKRLYDEASRLDSLGAEEEAISFYEAAYQGIDELSEEDQRGLLLGMGSTYRWINQLEKSESTFNDALVRFPEAIEFRVFRSLTLVDQGRSKKAIAELLEVLMIESQSESLRQYGKAIQYQISLLRDGEE